MKVTSRVDMVLMGMLEHFPWKIKYKWWGFFQMFSSILTHAFLSQCGIYLGISVSSCDFSTQMMMNDDKTYLRFQLIAVAF